MKIRRVRYGTMVADPPWPEVGGGKITRGAQKHYPVMKVPDIAALMARVVSRRMATNAHLYLWVTNNFLESGLFVMKFCGFRYVTLITWKKDRVGLGQYYRGVTEHTLFGIRGNPGYRVLPNGKRAQGLTGYDAPRGRHSEKPDQIHRWAEAVSPGPYIELFARASRPGWTVWGNEV